MDLDKFRDKGQVRSNTHVIPDASDHTLEHRSNGSHLCNVKGKTILWQEPDGNLYYLKMSYYEETIHYVEI